MKKFALTFLVLFALGFVAQGGTESISSKDVKQVVEPPCPEFYRDREWNVSVFGTYLFTTNSWEDDEYIQSDHGWGGGIDAKYFFHRNFGVGIEAWGVHSTRQRFEGIEFINNGITDVFSDDERIIGAVKGTITMRFPFKCSRFAPYIFGGIGAIFGGGETDSLDVRMELEQVADIEAVHHDGDAEFMGQVGAGFEYRLTPRIGIVNDFSWNFVTHNNSDFTMIRSGVNFAF